MPAVRRLGTLSRARWRSLLEWGDLVGACTAPQRVPCIAQFGPMHLAPLLDHVLGAPWQRSSEHSCRLDVNEGLMLSVAGMKMGGLMIACVHRDHDAEEAA